MYKSLKTKKYGMAIEIFNEYRRKMGGVYSTGIRNWNSDLCMTYSIVIYRLRIMFYVYNDNLTCAG